VLAVAAIGLGGFTIARRTLATVSDGITDLPILAAIVVSSIGATLITVLSYLGIPASLAVSTTCCIIGLGWGRASRAVTLAEIATPPVKGELGAALTTGALAAPTGSDDAPTSPTVGDLASSTAGERTGRRDRDTAVPPIGEERIGERSAESLFDRAATRRIIILWILAPSLSVVGSYLLFALVM
jgi:PiT family inorganic phosphate transporter